MIQTLVQILIFILLLGVIPFLAGGLFVRSGEEGMSPVFRWVSGQMLIWAGFQVICVPLILLRWENNFRYLCVLFGGFLAALSLLALGLEVRREKWLTALWAEAGRKKGLTEQERKDRKRTRPKTHRGFKGIWEADRTAFFLWLPVIGLIVLQQVLAAVLAYEEGDDAFYVATSVVTESSNTMYQILLYTGSLTGLSARHGLAPFPVWVAFLARLSGMHAATVAQIVLPVVLIAMAYSVFFLTGRRLLGEKPRELPLFLLFIGLLVMFGGQSLYTSENFLLVRTAQGKAVLAGIVIPFLFWLMFPPVERLQRGEKVGLRHWLLLGATMVSGCLCSTQGALLVCLLAGAGGLCTALRCRSARVLLPVAACCAVPMIFAVLYLLMD